MSLLLHDVTRDSVTAISMHSSSGPESYFFHSTVSFSTSPGHRENNRHIVLFVRSLTVSVGAERIVATQCLTELEEEDALDAAPQEPVLSPGKLPAVLSQMTNLATFSLRIELPYWESFNEDMVCPLLRSLPEFCVNLGLVLGEQVTRRPTERYHVCPEVAKCLPRLQQLDSDSGFCGPVFSDRVSQDSVPSGTTLSFTARPIRLSGRSSYLADLLERRQPAMETAAIPRTRLIHQPQGHG